LCHVGTKQTKRRMEVAIKKVALCALVLLLVCAFVVPTMGVLLEAPYKGGGGNVGDVFSQD